MNLSGRLLSFDKIIEEPLPPIEWVVESLIPHHNRVVVFGGFSSKKSWLLLDMGLHIAGGVQWLEKYPIPQPRSVLYIDEEMSQFELRRRVKRLAAGAGLESRNLPFRATSHLGLKFYNEGKTEALLRELKAEGFDPEIVIVETLRRVLNGNENEASDIGEFWHSVSPVVAAGKTLIISHHMRKPNAGFKEAARDRASGSTDILAAADCAFALIPDKGDFLKVQCVKSRSAKEPESFLFRLMDDEEGGEASYLMTVGESETDKAGLTQVEKATSLIKEYYGKAGDASVKIKDLYEDLARQGIVHRTAERAHRHYRDTGALERVRPGEYRKRTVLIAA